MVRPAGRKALPILALGLVFAASLALFYTGWKYDNKYTRPRHTAQMGVTMLDAAAYEENPFFYLVDGWAFYKGLHTPGELAAGGAAPDAYFYLGRYGGFDLGDANAPRHGAGTYRMTIFTGSDAPGEYALELTENYSAWNLWVNGELRQSVGMDVADAPAPADGLITFMATDKIEIVAAVQSAPGALYSGMVYPPAFGSPRAVARQGALRLIVHCAAAAAALLLGVLCLLAGAGLRFSRPYLGMFLLCLCFAVYTAWPLFAALGLRGMGWGLAERVCYYAMLALVIGLQGHLAGIPKKVFWPACAAALCVCLLVLAQPLLPMVYGSGYHAFGRVLEGWKWLAAAYLAAGSAWAAKRHRPGARLLLAGFLVFAAALFADRLWPMYEPVTFGWPQEWAGFVLMLVIAALLWRDTVRVYRQNLELAGQKKLAEAELAANRRYAALQQDYVAQSERHLHESRNRTLMLRHYARAGETQKLLAALDGQLKESAADEIRYSDNALLDTLLHAQFARAAAEGVYVEHRLSGIPARLPMEDAELASLVTNVLDNAVCAAQGAQSEKWLSFSLSFKQGVLTLHCANAKGPKPPQKRRGHGHGLAILREMAEKYGGAAETEDLGGSFETHIRLNLNKNHD